MVAVSAIRRIEVVGSSSGLDETRTKLEAVARAQTTVAQTAEGMAVTTEQSARRQLSAASNYDRLRRSIDETFRTEQRYAQGQSIIERAFEQGHIQAAEYARSLQLLADKHGVVSLAAARQTAELQRAAEMQARINAMTGVTGGSDTAARGADIEAYGQALSRLQAKYDPVFAASERYKASLTEIDQAQRVGAISIEIATQARLKAINSYNSEISALERVGAARKAAAQAIVDRQTVAPDRGADIAAYGKQLDDLRAKYSPLYAAGRQYKETLAKINAAAKVGAITEAERAAAVMDTKAAFVQQTNTLRGVRDAQDITSAASGKLAVGVGLARHELINLGRQAQDVIVSLQGGQGLGTVMLQQGSQIADVFVASKASIGDFANQSVNWLGRFLTAGRLVFGGVALSITGAALALNSYLDSQQRVQMSLLGSGRASGQSVGSINSVAQSSSSLTGFSVREAREFAAELASTGKIGRDNLEPIVKIGHDIATVFGIEAAEAAKMLGKAYADPVRGAEQLNARLGFLDASMQRQIQNLTAQGRVWEAQRVLQAGVESSLVGVNETLSTSTKFWTALGNVASNVWDRIGAAASRATGIGLKLGLDDQLAQAQARLQELEKIAERRSAAVNKGLGTTNQIEQQRAEIDKITEAMNRNAAATQAAQDRQRSFAQAQAVQQQLPDIAQVERLRNENELLVRTMIDVQTSGGAASPILKAMGVTYEQLAQAVQNSTSKVRNFKTEFEQATQAQQLQLQSLSAFSPAAKGDVAYQQRLNAERARETEETKAQALAEGDRAIAIKGVGVALSEAARGRELYARQSVTAMQLEIDMVGKTIGQQAEMRANLQARQALEQQASQNRTAFDEAEYARLKKINEELGKRAQELAKKQVNDQITFDRATSGLSQDDVQIAQQLRGIYPDVATALGSTEAAGMRLNNQLREARDISSGFANDLVGGLLRGEDAMKALGTAASGLVQKLSSANLTRFMQGGSFFGSQSLNSAQGALGLVGAGVAGYQSGNALTGALGGAMAGATFGPVGAVVGGITGLVGGLFGASEKSRKELEKAEAEWKAAGPAFETFLSQMTGGVQGSISVKFQQLLSQVQSFAQQAEKAKDFASIGRVYDSFNQSVYRTTNAFRQSFGGMLDAIDKGLGPSSPFAGASDNVKQVADTLKGFIDDVRVAYANDRIAAAAGSAPLVAGGGEGEIAAATAAAQKYLLTLLGQPPVLTETATAIQQMNGTAVQLKSALTDLGMSSGDAADAINRGVIAAMDALRTKFSESLATRLNTATGKGYLNDAAALLKQYQQDVADAASLGLDQAQVAAVFRAEAQKIVDDAGLIGDSFGGFIDLFPQFNGLVGQSATALAAATQKVQAFAKSLNDYLNNLTVGTNSTLSPQQQLAAAQSNFTAQMTLARSGDEGALGTITQYATTLLDQAKSFYASSSGYTAIYDQVTTALKELPGAIGAGDGTSRIVSAINQTSAASDQLLAAQNALALQQTSYMETQNSLLAAINGLADRFVNAINGLGVLTAQIGNFHSQQFGDMIGQLVSIARSSAQNTGGGSAWSWLGFQNGGIIPGYAGGGVVGNGIYGVDSVVARYAGGGSIGLAGGEYVMPADQTRQFRPMLDAMRSGNMNDNVRSDAGGYREVGAAINRQTEILARDNEELRATISDMKQEIKALNSKLTLVLAAA